MVAAFVHGFLLALALILPLGPQNTFVISQGTTHSQYRRTVPVVVTAALSDTVLIAVAVMGVSLVLLAIPWLKAGLTVLGLLFLVWMGWQSWNTPVHSGSSDDLSHAYWTLRRRVLYTLRASLLNPHAIMDTVVVIGGGAALYSHAGDRLAYASAAIFVSWAWFFAISLAGRFLRTLSALRLINRLSAAIMWTVAARYLITLGRMWWHAQA